MDDDVELVRRIANGAASGAAPRAAAAAEAELCRRYVGRIRLYGRRHLRDDQKAADLAQDVMAAVIEAARAGRIDDPARLQPFILGTSRFIAWRMRRGEHRRDATMERAYLEQPGVIEAMAWTSIDAGRLEQCLGALPEREQRVLYLSFYEEQSAQEIAATLSLSEANVRVIRHRALARLRASMAGEGEGAGR
jgi:RNA polymerase sigma-70 factor (ECF subfamily)